MRLGLTVSALALVLTLAACNSGDRRRDRGEGGTLSSLSNRGGDANAAGKEEEEEEAPQPDASATPAAPQIDATSQPNPNTAQRAAIMDALRPAIERELGGPIEFVLQRAAVQDGWALVIADPQRPGGGAIPAPASYAEEEHDGLTVNAILRFSGGSWTMVDHAVGPTDVWYCGVEGPPTSLTGC